MSPGPKRHRISLAICAGSTLLFALLTWFPPEGVSRVENQIRDGLVRQGRPAKPNPELVFLAIDKKSTDLKPGAGQVSEAEVAASPALKKLRAGWPLARDFYPLLIERLLNAGAKAVVLDLLFVAPRDEDPAFRAALDKYRDRVALGINFSDDSHARGGGEKNLLIPPESLIPREIGPADPRLGFVNFWPDGDGVVRRARYRVTQEELDGFLPGQDSLVFESLAARALRLGGHADKIPPGREAKLMRFARPCEKDADFGFAPYSLCEIFIDAIWNRPPYNKGEMFRGKIVMVGPYGDWSKDVIASPYGAAELPGPVIHLNAINAAINGDFLRETPLRANLALVLLAGCAALMVSRKVQWPLARFALLIGGMAGYCALALTAYNVGVYIMVFTPVLNFGTAGFTWLVWEQVLDRMDRLRTRRMVERYVSKDIVQEVLDNPESFLNTMKGQRKPVTVLFTDIRGFTTLTESADSEKLVSQLNEYFQRMVAIVFEHRGSLDKFIGDAVMAVWGSIRTEGTATDAGRAVTAGLQMQETLKQLNAEWRERGMPELHMGVGVNSGEAIVGNLGSNEKMEVTVIGDEVNLASRLEGLTKPFHQELILGDNTARLLSEQFHVFPVALVQVKNKTKPTGIYSVLGTPGEPLSESDNTFLCAFRAAIKAYRARNFGEAGRLFSESLAIKPGFELARLYIAECGELLANPPGPEWCGMMVMTSK